MCWLAGHFILCLWYSFAVSVVVLTFKILCFKFDMWTSGFHCDYPSPFWFKNNNRLVGCAVFASTCCKVMFCFGFGYCGSLHLKNWWRFFHICKAMLLVYILYCKLLLYILYCIFFLFITVPALKMSHDLVLEFWFLVHSHLVQNSQSVSWLALSLFKTILERKLKWRSQNEQFWLAEPFF